MSIITEIVEWLEQKYAILTTDLGEKHTVPAGHGLEVGGEFPPPAPGEYPPGKPAEEPQP